MTEGRIDVLSYSSDGGVGRFDDVAAARAAPGTTWVRATGDEAALLEAAEAFGVHRLSVEDVLSDVRAKTEEFPDHAFTLVTAAELTRGDRRFDEEVRRRPVGVCVGADWLLTLSPDPVPAVDRVWEAVEREDGRLLSRGADFAAYRVLDAVVDGYFDVLDELETDIEVVEDEVTVSTDIETLEHINDLRRDLLSFRKVAWPAREAVGALARGDPDQVSTETEKYFRDVYDHLVQVVDLTETYRDLTTGARDIYLNTVAQSTNEVMKTLTVVATVFLPLTFIAGVYGMNFAGSRYNMPELGWTLGFPAAVLGMAGVAAVMLWHFRDRGYV